MLDGNTAPNTLRFYSFTFAAGVLTLTLEDSVLMVDVDTSAIGDFSVGHVYNSKYYCLAEISITVGMISFDGAAIEAFIVFRTSFTV